MVDYYGVGLGPLIDLPPTLTQRTHHSVHVYCKQGMCVWRACTNFLLRVWVVEHFYRAITMTLNKVDDNNK